VRPWGSAVSETTPYRKKRYTAKVANYGLTKDSSLLSDTLIISALTGLAYSAVYVYDWAYCSYFHIPSDVISISVSNLVATALVFVAIAGYISIFAMASLANLTFRKVLTLCGTAVVAGGFAWFFVQPCLLVLNWFVAPGWLVILYKIVAAIIILVVIIASARQMMVAKSDPRLEDVANATPHLPRTVVIAALIAPVVFSLIFICSYDSGSYMAALRVHYFVTNESPPRVMLATFSDKAVLAQFDPSTHKVGPLISIIAIDKLPRMQYQRTGKLSCYCQQ